MTLASDEWNENEWELQRLEEEKEEQERDIQRETFRIDDWELTRAKEIYFRQSEAVQRRLALEREHLLEAEKQKQQEYLRILTKQQAEMDSEMAPKNIKETSTALWKRLTATMAIETPWTRTEDCILSFLLEALIRGMTSRAIQSSEDDLTLPNCVGSAFAFFFHHLVERNAVVTLRSAPSCKVKQKAFSF